jgi:hypothetical protein
MRGECVWFCADRKEYPWHKFGGKCLFEIGEESNDGSAIQTRLAAASAIQEPI